MKIKELIDKLQEIINQRGNIETEVLCDSEEYQIESVNLEVVTCFYNDEIGNKKIASKRYYCLISTFT